MGPPRVGWNLMGVDCCMLAFCSGQKWCCGRLVLGQTWGAIIWAQIDLKVSSSVRSSVSRGNIHTAASAAAYRAATFLTQHLASAAAYRAAINILTQQRPQQRIAPQHPHTAASAAPYRAATCSHSSVRSSVSRSNILTQQRPQHRIAQQHPHTAASAAAYRAATSSHSSVRSSFSHSSVRSSVSRSNILTQRRPQQRLAQLTSSHSSVRSSVSRSNILTQQRRCVRMLLRDTLLRTLLCEDVAARSGAVDAAV